VNDVLDPSIAMVCQGGAYMGWIYPAKAYADLFEVHYVPNDDSKAVCIVSFCDLKQAEELGNVLETLAADYPHLLSGHRTKPYRLWFQPTEGKKIAVTLSPMADTTYCERYQDRPVTQLVWSDDKYNFPWDADWVYRDGVQFLMGTQGASVH